MDGSLYYTNSSTDTIVQMVLQALCTTTTNDINDFTSLNNIASRNNIIDHMIYCMPSSPFHHKLSFFHDMDNAGLVLNYVLCIYWNDSASTRVGSQWCDIPYESASLSRNL